MYFSLKSKLYQKVKRFAKLRSLLPLKINSLTSIYDVVNVSGLEFVILRESLDMREFLVNESFVEHSFVLENSNPLRFLDVGCHIGTWSIYFASKGVETIGVDAAPELLTCLRASLQLNNFTSITLNEIVGPASSNLIFTRGQNSLTGSATRTASQVNGTGPMSLPKLLRDFSPDFVKLDIEGLDVECVLETPKNLLKQLRYLVIELESNGFMNSELISKLRTAGLHPLGFFDLGKKFHDPANISELKVIGNLHFRKLEN